MRLLVSPINIDEARSAMLGGADILDVKNPKEGSLGANFPWAIKQIADMARGIVPISATIGDLDYKPGTASLAALGAAFSGADYIKAGLLGIRTVEQAEDILSSIVKSVKEFDPKKKVVAAAYSDYKRVGSISPMVIPGVANKVGADLVMVDTAIKDGKSTFEFMSQADLEVFINLAHNFGEEVAIAGTIGFQHLQLLKGLQPDIIGVRGVVCGGDRQDSIKVELVEKLKELLN